MLQSIARRLPGLLLVVVAVLSLLFVLLHASGDPAVLLVGPVGDPELVAATRAQLGLDRPLYVQYVDFLRRSLTLDFGDSFIQRSPAMQLALDALPRTALLAGIGLAWAVAAGLLLGIVAAVNANGPVGLLVTSLALIGQSVPNFLLAILLVMVFSVRLGLLPTFGYGTWEHLVLPAVALSARLMAQVARLTRAELRQTLSEDYVRTARAKGVASSAVVVKHALTNSLIPVMSVVGLEASKLIGGSMIIEIIFAWPGTGSLLADAILRKDFPVIQASVFLLTLVVVIVNFLTDVAYTVIDPRIRHA